MGHDLFIRGTWIIPMGYSDREERHVSHKQYESRTSYTCVTNFIYTGEELHLYESQVGGTFFGLQQERHMSHKLYESQTSYV